MYRFLCHVIVILVRPLYEQKKKCSVQVGPESHAIVHTEREKKGRVGTCEKKCSCMGVKKCGYAECCEERREHVSGRVRVVMYVLGRGRVIARTVSPRLSLVLSEQTKTQFEFAAIAGILQPRLQSCARRTSAPRRHLTFGVVLFTVDREVAHADFRAS